MIYKWIIIIQNSSNWIRNKNNYNNYNNYILIIKIIITMNRITNK